MAPIAPIDGAMDACGVTLDLPGWRRLAILNSAQIFTELFGHSQGDGFWAPQAQEYQEGYNGVVSYS